MTAVENFSGLSVIFNIAKKSEQWPLLDKLTIDGFAWDVELLWLARRGGLSLAERPVEWNNAEGSKVAMVADPLRMLRDLLRVRMGR